MAPFMAPVAQRRIAAEVSAMALAAAQGHSMWRPATACSESPIEAKRCRAPGSSRSIGDRSWQSRFRSARLTRASARTRYDTSPRQRVRRRMGRRLRSWSSFPTSLHRFDRPKRAWAFSDVHDAPLRPAALPRWWWRWCPTTIRSVRPLSRGIRTFVGDSPARPRAMPLRFAESCRKWDVAQGLPTTWFGPTLPPSPQNDDRVPLDSRSEKPRQGRTRSSFWRRKTRMQPVAEPEFLHRCPAEMGPAESSGPHRPLDPILRGIRLSCCAARSSPGSWPMCDGIRVEDASADNAGATPFHRWPAPALRYQGYPELGGRRSPRAGSANTRWRSASFRGYADYGHAPFRRCTEATDGRRRSHQDGDHVRRSAVGGACHRALIADALQVRGGGSAHIMGKRKGGRRRRNAGGERRERQRKTLLPAFARATLCWRCTVPRGSIQAVTPPPGTQSLAVGRQLPLQWGLQAHQLTKTVPTRQEPNYQYQKRQKELEKKKSRKKSASAKLDKQGRGPGASARRPRRLSPAKRPRPREPSSRATR